MNSKSLKIAILGSRGIPNQYGGFEQFAQLLSVYLVQKGHEVAVYNPHFHPFEEKCYNGVKIIKKYSPEKTLGSAANFIYDFLCLKHASKQNFDILLELGYASVAISFNFIDTKNSILITNMDGLEWKRSKWNKIVKYFIKQFEKLAVKKSDVLVADNEGIKNYLNEKYNTNATFIAYPAEIIQNPDESILEKYNVVKNNYYLMIARLEPENNILEIITGYLDSNKEAPILIIGNLNTKYGKILYQKYNHFKKIVFLDGIYDKTHLDCLRYYCRVYFHGHSVGGTNPSLLEAMSAKALILAHKNHFNQTVLGLKHSYFSKSEDIANILTFEEHSLLKNKDKLIQSNLLKIQNNYSQKIIFSAYEKLFLNLTNSKKD